MAHADAILDTFVVLALVFLALSFCTYAIQAAVKAAIRLRGRHVNHGLESLVRLVCPTTHDSAAVTSRSRPTRSFGVCVFDAWESITNSVGTKATGDGRAGLGESQEPLGPAAATLLATLTEVLRQLDRIELLRIGVIDRLSITSLAIDRVPADTLVPATKSALQPACDSITAAGAILASIDLPDVPVTGEPLLAKVLDEFRTLAAIRSSFTAADGRIRADLATSDILQTSVFDAAMLVSRLAELRALIRTDRRAKQPQRGHLDALDALLTDATARILDATSRLNAVHTQLETRVNTLRRACETVMTTVERRYGVAVRRVITAVSVVAVMLLDADVFRMYDSVARRELTRFADQTIAADLVSRETLLRTDEQQLNQERVATPVQMAMADSTEVLDINTAALSALHTDRRELLRRLRKEEHDLHELTQQFAGVGLESPTPTRVGRWWAGFKYRDYPDDGSSWFERRAEDLKHLIGCLVSALVLMTGTRILRAVGKKLGMLSRNMDQNETTDHA